MEENNNTIRQVNGRDVNPTSDLITVEILDWSKLNPDINFYMHTRMPERKDDEFYFDDRYSGLIEINKSICLISTKEAVTIEPEIFDYKQSIIGFSMGIYLKDKNPNVFNTIPEFYFSLMPPDIEKIKTGVKMKLPDFMGERYKYNSRISGNELSLIKFLIENEYKPFEKLKKQNPDEKGNVK